MHGLSEEGPHARLGSMRARLCARGGHIQSPVAHALDNLEDVGTHVEWHEVRGVMRLHGREWVLLRAVQQGPNCPRQDNVTMATRGAHTRSKKRGLTC